MKLLPEYKEEIMAQGYSSADAEARLCQDIVLKALSNSSLSRNATIKGGVVMRSLSGDARRATQDMDIDFIRYKLKHCFAFYIYSDPDMRENSIEDICKRVNVIFENQAYMNMLKTTDKNWLEEDVNEVVKGIESFLESDKFVD